MTTPATCLDAIQHRKSVRAFQDRAIPPETLAALWEAARWAPSSMNMQDWRYYAFTGAARARLAEVLMPMNHWALRAGLVLGVSREASLGNMFDSREYGVYDVALSVMSLVIEAEHQGLRSHQLAGFDGAAFRRVVGLPDTEEPVVMVAVGYEGAVADLPADVRAKEGRPRERHPLDRILHLIDA